MGLFSRKKNQEFILSSFTISLHFIMKSELIFKVLIRSLIFKLSKINVLLNKLVA